MSKVLMDPQVKEMRRELCRMKRKLEKFVGLDADARQALRPELETDLGKLHQLAVDAGIASPRTEHDVEELQAEIQKHLQEASSKEEEIVQLKKVIANAGNNAWARVEAEARLKSSLGEQVAENKDLMTRVVELEAHLAQEQADNDRRIAKLNAEIKSLQRNSALSDMNQEAVQAMHAKLDSRTAEVERLRLQNGNLLTTYQTVQEHIARLENENDELTRALEELHERYQLQEAERHLSQAQNAKSTPPPVLQQAINATFTPPADQVMNSRTPPLYQVMNSKKIV
jgi:chromosome segregation ATPase